MSQAAWKATIKKLEKRAAQLQEEYDDLACTHDLLACRESVYNAWCQGISVLDHLAAGTPATRKALGSCYPQLAALQQQEQLLMQQLTDSSTETAHHMMEQLQPEEEEDEDDTHPAACGAFDAGVETIAPLSDPLQYFRQIAVQPRMPEAASMTVVELSQLYKSVVMDMSMQLHLLHNGFEVVSEDQAVLRIKAGMDRYIQALISLVVADKHDVLEKHYTYNCDRLVPFVTLPEQAPDLAAAAAAKVHELQLSEEQQRIIANGTSVLQEQLDAIASERQCLQSEIAEEVLCGCSSSAAAAGSAGMMHHQHHHHGSGSGGGGCSSGGIGSPALTASGNSAFSAGGGGYGSGYGGGYGGGYEQQHPHLMQHGNSSSAGGGSSSSGDGGHHVCFYHMGCHVSSCNALSRRWSQLDQQQQRLRRLAVVLRKEALLRVSGMAWCLGCLSWKQLAQAAVMCWPYPVQLSIWPVAIQLYYYHQQALLEEQRLMNEAAMREKAATKKKPGVQKPGGSRSS